MKYSHNEIEGIIDWIADIRTQLEYRECANRAELHRKYRALQDALFNMDDRYQSYTYKGRKKI